MNRVMYLTVNVIVSAQGPQAHGPVTVQSIDRGGFGTTPQQYQFDAVVPLPNRRTYIQSTSTRRTYHVHLGAHRDAGNHVSHTVEAILRDIKDRTIRCEDLLVLLDTNATSSIQDDKKNISTVMAAVKQMMDSHSSSLKYFRIDVTHPMVNPPYDPVGVKSTHLVTTHNMQLSC